MPKTLGVKTQISQKCIKIFDMLSKMHAKDAFWMSLFFKIFFSCTIIVISRKYGGDKNVKMCKIYLKVTDFSLTFLKSRKKR